MGTIQTHPGSETYVTAGSGNVAAAAAVAALPAVAGKTNYVCGFTITSTGSTATAIVRATLAGLISGTLGFTYVTLTGATLANPTVVVNFNTPIPASAVNTAITFTLPSLGAGNTNAEVNIWGFLI